jgi:tetratricopeptide (TPR) repeat protein
VSLLETIRTFAWEELQAAGEADVTHALHAHYFAGLAERLQALRESRHLTALGRAETELDNFRQALDWADVTTGLRLCAALGWVWWMGGYVTEGRRWHERIIAQAAGEPSRPLATCLGGLANILLAQGEPKAAADLARRSLTMARTLGDPTTEAFALNLLGTAQVQLGDVEAARVTIQESLATHGGHGDQVILGRALGHLAGIEESLGNFDRAEELMQQSLQIFFGVGDEHEAAVQRQNLANLLALSGRAQEAGDMARELIDTVLELRSPNLTMAFANTYMNILIRLGDPARAAELFGAEEGMRERLAMPNPYRDEELEEALALVAGAISVEDWDRHRRIGQGTPVEDLLAQLRTS